MATEEHKRLANQIKNVHESLRKSAKDLGVQTAWEEHLRNKGLLDNYSKAMKHLAEIWENNAKSTKSSSESRINWTISYCTSYFVIEKLYLEKRLKEERLAAAIGINTDFKDRYISLDSTIKLLDVGSCFNPFRNVEIFDVIAIDLGPADDSVYVGDFLKIELASDVLVSSCGKEIKALPKSYFDCIVFSLLLEYLPLSDQRIECCKRASELLKFEGILVIITPDSQHVGKNAKLMKNWRYTLGKLGFTRIKFEKLSHITCLVFRKCLSKQIAERWSDIHKEPYMTFSIDIPQDSQ